jgi:cation diffusion facilitator family transporter
MHPSAIDRSDEMLIEYPSRAGGAIDERGSVRPGSRWGQRKESRDCNHSLVFLFGMGNMQAISPEIQAKKTRVARLSVASNMVLTTGKLVIGLLIGSVSILSEAIHSGIDLIAAMIAWWAVHNSGKPADRQHPFGHGKIENISGAIEAILIFAAAIWIIYEAIHKLMFPVEIETIGLGVGMMVVSAVMNIIVSSQLFKVGRATDSQALLADAWHLRTDVYTSIGVVVGLTLIMIGERFIPSVDWHWVDPTAAIIVALLIIKAAFELTAQSISDLVDSALPLDEVQWIRSFVRESGNKILSFHSLRTRKSGANRFVEFHLSVEPQMSVKDSHDIAQRLEDGIMKRFPGASVTIHVEPCDAAFCEPSCQSGCSNVRWPTPR